MQFRQRNTKKVNTWLVGKIPCLSQISFEWKNRCMENQQSFNSSCGSLGLDKEDQFQGGRFSRICLHGPHSIAAGCGFCDLESEHTVRAMCLDLATGFVGLYYSKPCGCLDFVLGSVLL